MNDTIQLTPAMLALVPIIAYFVQIIKSIITDYAWFAKAKKFLPLVAVFFGIGLSYLCQIDNFVVAGILEGIAAVAGYETLKLPGNGPSK